jgi:hypothetical protein
MKNQTHFYFQFLLTKIEIGCSNLPQVGTLNPTLVSTTNVQIIRHKDKCILIGRTTLIFRNNMLKLYVQ